MLEDEDAGRSGIMKVLYYLFCCFLCPGLFRKESVAGVEGGGEGPEGEGEEMEEYEAVEGEEGEEDAAPAE